MEEFVVVENRIGSSPKVSSAKLLDGDIVPNMLSMFEFGLI